MKGFLTSRQYEILKYRKAGKSQKEIALILGTTRENISIAEKRAKDNVRKARNTLEAYELISAIEISLQEIEDFLTIPSRIFAEADIHNIKVRVKATAILELAQHYKEKHGIDPETVYLLNSGKVIFEDEPSICLK